ncbi:hypothetical protein AAIH51_36290, partial [Pseudomonas aeruginosa]
MNNGENGKNPCLKRISIGTASHFSINRPLPRTQAGDQVGFLAHLGSLGSFSVQVQPDGLNVTR